MKVPASKEAAEMQNVNSVQSFIREAIECSVYLSPRDIGLTLAEIQEAAKQAGYRPGETQDALGVRRYLGTKCLPNQNEIGLPMGLLSTDFNFRFEPDLRKWETFEFVRQELADLAREVGAANAVLDRDTFVERGVAKGHERQPIEVALTVTVLTGILTETKDGRVGAGRQM